MGAIEKPSSGCLTRAPKEGPTLLISDEYYMKSICPSGGHGCGHRARATKPGCGSTRTVNR